jgi:hypothetical protein
MKPINRVLLGLSKRAERATSAQLVSSFVDAGSLLASIGNNDHQIIFGRRGTGKTHVLAKLSADAKALRHLPISIDLRTLGSTGGIYTDPSIPLPERSTRLLIDLLWALHDGILEHAIDDKTFDLHALQPPLDALRAAISQVKVIGQVVQTDSSNQADSSGDSFELQLNGNPVSPVSAGYSSQSNRSSSRAESTTTTGDVRHRVNFGNVANCLKRVSESVEGRRIWLLLDEWSEVPLDLQPYLADLLRRSIFPVQGVVAKISAIEQRTNFRIEDGYGGYIGIEIGADAAASLTLDDFMVFDNNSQAATNFFRSLLWKHATAMADDPDIQSLTESAFAAQVFTQINALQELVRAAEGVPRDAINIISLAAQSAVNRSIAVADIRSSAQQWYQQSKESAVGSRARALKLLQWIRENVIGARRARAFLLPSDVRNDLIDYLYDSRVLHVIKKGVSSNDTPGVRYNVYAIDYGCYVDLTTTSNAPLGLFQIDGDQDDAPRYVEVPATDYRSIRRAILNLEDFYEHVH